MFTLYFEGGFAVLVIDPQIACQSGSSRSLSSHVSPLHGIANQLSKGLSDIHAEPFRWLQFGPFLGLDGQGHFHHPVEPEQGIGRVFGRRILCSNQQGQSRDQGDPLPSYPSTHDRE